MTHRDNCQPEVEKFFDKFPPAADRAILELGQGTDTQFRALFEQKYALKYVGIDPLPVRNGSDCYQGKMEALPFPNNMFDFVFACHAFEHTERPVDSLREALRVLKPGGWLLFVTPQHCEHHILKADADHINVVTDMQMKRLLFYTGFTEISVYTSTIAPLLQDYNLISFARKP